MPNDGDQARPIEVLTNGLQSRRQCDREISYILAPGTPVLCHGPSAKGSQLKAESTWKVAIGMQDEQAVLRSPYTRMASRSKSWTAFKLESGLRCTKFPKLQPEPQSKRQAQIASDLCKKVVIKLPEFSDMDISSAQRPSSRQPLIAVKFSIEPQPNLLTVTYGVDKGASPTELAGSVVVQNEKGQEMETDLSNGQLFLDNDDEDSNEGEDDDPTDPEWGNVPHQQDHKTLECGQCKTSFRSRNLLVKHLKDANYHQVTMLNTKQRGSSDVPLVKSSKKWLESVVYIGADEYNKVEAFAVQAKCITSHTNHRFAEYANYTNSKLHYMTNIEIGY